MSKAGYANLSTAPQASLNGVNPTLLYLLNQLGQKYGPIQVISGYRSPSYSAKVGGYANDPHSRGEAVDAYINGKPIGEVIPLNVLTSLGLQGGNQPGFYKGGTDPEHVQIPGSGVDKSMVSPALSQATGVPQYGNTPPTTASSAGSPLSSKVLNALQQYPKLDPKAVLAIAGHEGLSGGIGDGGHAFGPFQLNNAGGVISGMFPDKTPEQINQWAWSPQGLNFALGKINDVAGGLKGNAAISNIASRFERPADVQGEIADAESHYGSMPTGGSTFAGAGAPAPSQGATATLMSSVTQPQTQQIATQHIQGAGTGLALQLLDSAQNMLNGGGGNLSSLFAAAKGYQQASKAVKPALGGSALQVKSGGLSF